MSTADGCIRYICQFAVYRGLDQVCLSVCLLQTAVSGISVSLSTTEGCIKYICQFAFYRRLYQVYLLVSVYYRGLYQVCLPVCLLQTAVSSISASLSTEEGCIRYICQFVYYRRLFQVCLSLCLLKTAILRLKVCLVQTTVSSLSVSLSTIYGCIKSLYQFVYYRQPSQVSLSFSDGGFRYVSLFLFLFKDLQFFNSGLLAFYYSALSDFSLPKHFLME